MIETFRRRIPPETDTTRAGPVWYVSSAATVVTSVNCDVVRTRWIAGAIAPAVRSQRSGFTRAGWRAGWEVGAVDGVVVAPDSPRRATSSDHARGLFNPVASANG